MLWVDAMRGFSMIVVVLGHVLLYMDLGLYNSVLSSILITFRMPLFFFVSGFFSFRAVSWWNKSKAKDILTRKFQAQIICTIVFISIYQYVTGVGNWLKDGFGGYWFTIVLFQMYMLYMLLSCLSKYTKRDFVIPVMILLSVIGIGIIAAGGFKSPLYDFLSWEELCKYLQFFSLGLICSKFRTKFFNSLNNNRIITAITIGFIISFLLCYDSQIRQYNYIYKFLHDFLARYCSLIIVITLFFNNQSLFNGNSKPARTLKFIGQRTLDIYMIHYFFLPNLRSLYPYLKNDDMIVLQLIISLTITAVIVTLSLLVSAILRQSTTLQTWLFGVKQKNYAIQK